MITANMATYPARREGLEKVVRALAPQVDRLNLVLNQYDAELPELGDIPNLVQIIPHEDTKDAGKFYPDTSGTDWLLYVDDDIIYPADFVAKAVASMEALPAGRWLGGYHASTYFVPKFSLKPKALLGWLKYKPGLIAEYRTRYRFYEALPHPVYVDQIATNAAILRGADAPSYAYMRDSQKFVDVRLAKWVFEQGIAPVALPKAAGWLGELRYEETIYQGFTRQNPPHVAEEIWSFALKRANRDQPVR